MTAKRQQVFGAGSFAAVQGAGVSAAVRAEPAPPQLFSRRLAF